MALESHILVVNVTWCYPSMNSACRGVGRTYLLFLIELKIPRIITFNLVKGLMDSFRGHCLVIQCSLFIILSITSALLPLRADFSKPI